MTGILDERAALLDADRHLRTAVYLIAAQQSRVMQYKVAGLKADAAEELLCVMNTILRTFVVHRQQILDAIAIEQAQHKRLPR